MARESVSDRLNRAAASIEGVASFLNDMVQSEDKEAAKQAFAHADLLARISDELSDLGTEVRS